MEIFLIVEVFVNIEMIVIHRIVCCRLYFFAFDIFSDLITKRPWMWIRQNVNREKYAYRTLFLTIHPQSTYAFLFCFLYTASFEKLVAPL